MVKREEVEEMLIGCGEPPLNTKDDLCLVPATTLAELCRTWLAVDGAPAVEWYGYESNFEDYRNLVGQRVKLVLVPEAGGGEG